MGQGGGHVYTNCRCSKGSFFFSQPPATRPAQSKKKGGGGGEGVKLSSSPSGCASHNDLVGQPPSPPFPPVSLGGKTAWQALPLTLTPTQEMFFSRQIKKKKSFNLLLLVLLLPSNEIGKQKLGDYLLQHPFQGANSAATINTNQGGGGGRTTVDEISGKAAANPLQPRV